MAFRLVLTTIAALSCWIVPSQAEQWRCDISQKLACEGQGTCRSVPTGVWNTLTFSPNDQPTFARCNKNGCDTYPMQTHLSGIFIVIDLPGRGMVAKLNLDSFDFVEVVTLGTSVLNSFGKCRKL